MQRQLEDMKSKIDVLSASTVDQLIRRVRNLASRPAPEFNKYEVLELIEALKNAAQDANHEKRDYCKATFETLREKVNQPDEMFRSYLLPLLGDKDHEKILEIIARVEKHADRRSVSRRNAGPYKRSRDRGGLRCFYCHQLGHFRAECPKRHRRPSNSHPSQEKFKD